MRSVKASIEINTTPLRVIQSFLDATDLSKWWHVGKSLVQQKPGGMWTLVWEVSSSGMKYMTCGIIQNLHADGYLKVSNLIYIHAEKHILGPMDLEITVSPENENICQVQIHQSGFLFGGDWDWYFNAVQEGWPHSLELLKNYLERK